MVKQVHLFDKLLFIFNSFTLYYNDSTFVQLKIQWKK